METLFLETERVSMYDKNKDLKEVDVKILVNWVNQQAHLPKIEDFQAISFLQRCNYQMENAKRTIDLYFTMRTLCPNIFIGRDLSGNSLKKELNQMVYSVLPKTTLEGYTIVFLKMVDDNFNFLSNVIHFNILCMLALYQTKNSLGYIIVTDCNEFTGISEFDFVLAGKFTRYIQKCIPLQWKSIHIFDNGPFAKKILSILNPVFEEFKDKIMVHSSLDKLCTYVPKECLPKDYGGDAPDLATLQDEFRKKVIENRKIFEFEETQIVDETKRPGKPKTVNDVFGIELSF